MRLRTRTLTALFAGVLPAVLMTGMFGTTALAESSEVAGYSAVWRSTAGFTEINGSWYYLDGSGNMLTGWQEYDDNWYYMGSDGKMLTGWQQIGG